MVALELLAPARNADIGIAAIDCGADAVYIGGPLFGARAAAGNSVQDIRRLCEYASLFGVRIYLTVNTLLQNKEEQLKALDIMLSLKDSGVSAFILQDTGLLGLLDRHGPWKESFHASTQCAIRTPERALELARAGFSRLILERQLSLEQISAIRNAVPAECELEFFVHGALCVCYSGDCYLSEALAGRSANRGECAQPCRSRYDLFNSDDRLLVKDSELLSLKDLCLIDRLPELAGAGIVSFKIEGRLKGESYVRNVVRAYSDALDTLTGQSEGRYRRCSFGTIRGGFVPELEKSFNRGFTRAFIDGDKQGWNSEASAKSMGGHVGLIREIKGRDSFILNLDEGISLSNGDGLAVVHKDFPADPTSRRIISQSRVTGFRADVVKPLGRSSATVLCKSTEGLKKGDEVWRNFDASFEKTVAVNRPRRLLRIELALSFNEGRLTADALREDGMRFSKALDISSFPVAEDRERMENIIRNSLDKTAGRCLFHTASILSSGDIPLLPVSLINSLRRALSDASDDTPLKTVPRARAELSPQTIPPAHPRRDGELMRTRYCIRHRLGLCPRLNSSKKTPDAAPGPAKNGWYIMNNGRKIRLEFDCQHCEMVVKDFTTP